MNEQIPRSRARVLLGAALVIGVAADLLIREEPWRLGFTLWILVALAVAAVVTFTMAGAPSPSGEVRRGALLLLGLTAIGSLAFATTDAEPLYAFSFLAMLMGASLLPWLVARRRALAGLRVRDLPLVATDAAFSVAFGAPALALRDGALGRADGAAASRSRVSVVGIVAAVPVLLVVGVLLAGSDPVFDALVSQVAEALVSDLTEHVLVTGFFTWVAAGWLRAFQAPIGLGISLEDERFRPSEGLRLLMPTLYVLTALLALYLGVQARTLFGGEAYVESTSGLTYAQYARSGVFGLVVVAGIVLGALVAASWLVDRGDSDETARFRGIGWVLIALVAVLIASAAQRMALYVDFYGLTAMRVYAIAATAVVALSFVLCGLTLMRLHGERFTIGVLATCASVLMLLHVVNPERLVVRVNSARAMAGASFDVEYHATLSADAVPSVLAAAARMPREACAALATRTHEVWTERFARQRSDAWTTFSYPRSRAKRLLAPPAAEVVRRWCGG